MDVNKRFNSKFKTGSPDECWEWQGGLFSAGYGAFWLNGKQCGAHRVALALHLGVSIEDIDTACHSCDNPRCVNPKHLFNGTVVENNEDRENKGRGVRYFSTRTACSRGHSYVEGSFWTRERKNGTTERVCKQCSQIRNQRRGSKNGTTP